MLAKRLVQHMSASDDAEASMISKLKQACGFEYTSKLQRMFQDIGVSKDLNEQFRNHMANSNESLGKTALLTLLLPHLTLGLVVQVLILVFKCYRLVPGHFSSLSHLACLLR